MAAQYTEISLEEMETFLKRAFRILRPVQGVFQNEYYYDLKVGDAVGIRVWTSVKTYSGVGARAGADLIKVQLVSLKDHKPLEGGKIKREDTIKRTQGWRDGLRDRVENFVEKYEDNDEFWENWAETRQRKGVPEKVMEQQEKAEKEEAKQETREEWERKQEELGVLGEGEEEAPPPQYQRTVPQQTTQYKLHGEITDKQARFIRGLLRNVDAHMWVSLGLADITGFDHIPSQAQLLSLNKRQASQVIDILVKSGHARRYASETFEAFGDE